MHISLVKNDSKSSKISALEQWLSFFILYIHCESTCYLFGASKFLNFRLKENVMYGKFRYLAPT
jgi:hypothetical protein